VLVALVAALRGALDLARAAAAERRREAVQAEAPQLAKPGFDGAQARLADADALAARQSLPGATQAYQEAAQRFGEATRVARAQRDARAAADQTRRRMTAEKESPAANPDAPDFAAGLAKERQGADLYQRAAFKEASEAWGAAAALYAKARLPARPEPRPEPRPSPADEIRELLVSYARAFEAKDVGRLQKLRPGLKPADVQQLRQTFDLTREYRVTLKVDDVKVTGDEAIATGQREDRAVARDGRPYGNTSEFTVHLRRVAAPG
jgi:hypothetical protein